MYCATFLQPNQANPHWFNRNRFVLSIGQGAMFPYSLRHLTGYDFPLDQIKQFRQWGSLTPGHPQRGVPPGGETITGRLGQGFGNGVGMAIHSLAGPASMLVNIPSLITVCYTEAANRSVLMRGEGRITKNA